MAKKKKKKKERDRETILRVEKDVGSLDTVLLEMQNSIATLRDCL